MKKVKNILVPIDFSVTSRNAYRYARELSETLDATVTVINIKENFMMVSDVMMVPFPEQESGQLMRDVREFIADEDTMVNKLAGEHAVKIKIMQGNPVDVLVELSENEDTDLIVIGTTGLQDVLSKIVGSVSLKVANKAHCPVILVPRDAKWYPIEQIMYASNYDSMTAKAVHEIADFAINIDADIHFVNVKNFDPVFEVREKEIDWSELFTLTDSSVYFDRYTIYGNDTIEKIIEFNDEKNINLMAFVSKHRNFWENLIHKSVTENMALSTTIPMMVMHLDDEKRKPA